MDKRTMTAALFFALSGTLLGCTPEAGRPAHAPVAAPSEAAVQPATAAPTAEPSAEPTAQPTMTPSPSPSPTVTPSPSTAPEPSAPPQPATPAASAGAGTSGSAAAPAGDRAPLSWYYMKKKTGIVPDFPKETKGFTAEQKAVWVGTGKKVYLTIDAGGPLVDVDLMLKSLKDNDVKANFFIAGYNIKSHPDYLQRLVEDGHLVANHTMTHKDFNELTDEQIQQEITNFEQMYKEITGQEVAKYFRFPYGKYNLHALNLVAGMGYTSVFWSTAMRDWEPRKNGAEDPYNDIMNNLHDGNVILMHQGSKENMEALDRICKEIKSRGYEFALVSELQP